MTKEEKRIELAKIDGWLDVKEYTHSYDYAGEIGEFKRAQGRQPGSLHELQPLKPYLESYDAIIPLLQKQTPAVIEEMAHHATQRRDSGGTKAKWWFQFTPEELSDDLLKAFGKLPPK